MLLAGLAAATAITAWASSTASQQNPNEPEPSPGPPSPNLPPGEPRIGLSGRRVLLVGDSLAVGLKRRMNERAGASGAMFFSDAEQSTFLTVWSKHRFAQDLDNYKPDIVLVSLGTNDSGGTSVEMVRRALSAMLSQAKSRGVRVYWIGLPSLPSRLALAPSIRQVIRESGTPYYESEREPSFERAPDGVHCTPRGYSTWADGIWAWLESLVP